MKVDRIYWNVRDFVDTILGNFPCYRKWRGGRWRFVPKGKIR